MSPNALPAVAARATARQHEGGHNRQQVPAPIWSTVEAATPATAKTPPPVVGKKRAGAATKTKLSCGFLNRVPEVCTARAALTHYCDLVCYVVVLVV